MPTAQEVVPCSSSMMIGQYKAYAIESHDRLSPPTTEQEAEPCSSSVMIGQLKEQIWSPFSIITRGIK